jgi:hypothetical protein
MRVARVSFGSAATIIERASRTIGGAALIDGSRGWQINDVARTAEPSTAGDDISSAGRNHFRPDNISAGWRANYVTRRACDK